MIAPRDQRRGLTAAGPILVVGMAPSRNGADLSDSSSSHPPGKTLSRLASYANVNVDKLVRRMEFANLLEGWPGEYDAELNKWDVELDKRDWAVVGQRAELLRADLLERPRRLVVGLGGWVRDALAHWWDLPAHDWLEIFTYRHLGVHRMAWSPHPAGTSMWWNDPANLVAGSVFWTELAARQLLPLPRTKVPLPSRTRWLLTLCQRFQAVGWPAECVDWPFVDPAGRPQAIDGGRSVPASQLVLKVCGVPKPTPQHQALHSCDRGEHCVNLLHLRWGVELENRIDMVRRSRGSIGKIGLPEAEALLLRFEGFCQVEADRYEVTKDAIKGIVAGRSWAKERWETAET